MRSLLIASFFIVVAAVSAPRLFTHYMQRPTATHVATEAEAVSNQSAEKPSTPARQVQIRAAGDGHFYVDAAINFRHVRLMVDTGATVVALRASDAQTAGIRMSDADFVNPVQTANGTTMAAETMLESVSVDDIEVRNIRALVLPDDQLSLSLLGGSFLRGLERFEVANGTLIFEN